MFLKRPANNAKFRSAISCPFNVKRCSLAHDKRRRNIFAFILRRLHVFGTLELKFKVGNAYE